MEKGRVFTEIMDGVGLLTFGGNDPHNAMSADMWQQLGEALDRLEGDDQVRVLVLTGAGHLAFATDPEDDSAEHDATEDADPARDACARLARFAKPVVARIRGTCAGAGVALVLACDIRIAAQDSDFALSAERAAALGAERALVAAVGASQARFLLLTAQKIEAPEAHRIGLVHRVVPDAELSDSVADLVRSLVDREPDALCAAKQALADLSGENSPVPPPQHPQ